MTDERKPLAPDRPGRYLQRNGEVVHIDEVCGRWSRQAEDSCYYHWNNGTSVTRPLYDIIARAPDDAAWCLAQARLLCPDGYAVVPVEPTEAMLSCLDDRNPPMGPPEKLTEEYAVRWRDRHRRANGDTYRAMIAAAAKGK